MGLCMRSDFISLHMRGKRKGIFNQTGLNCPAGQIACHKMSVSDAATPESCLCGCRNGI